MHTCTYTQRNRDSDGDRQAGRQAETELEEESNGLFDGFLQFILGLYTALNFPSELMSPTQLGDEEMVGDSFTM